MSKKLTGNGLFDSSRFMLPEHSERIRQHYIEEKRKAKPVLDDQEVQLIEQAIIDSYNTRTPITLVIFGPFDNNVISGVVVSINAGRREVKLSNETGEYSWIKLEDVISIS